ncbi:histidine kinase [Glycomyces sp. A-F 0318]|uniref:sensor histidine kinase n=1 Tax=Glycomyces amatae TaxID=2881355 RepID=UPI001E4085D8|nr:histidine kinase [Glycomyces amatae]MCD0445393.1 histidine kinase [Glycomyces amatae]
MSEHDEAGPTAPPSPVRWFDERLARLGVTGLLGRDAVLAVAVALATLAFYGVLLPLAATDGEVALTAPQVGTVVAIGCAQSLLLCVRRLRPRLCLAAAMACQLLIVAAAPDLSANGFALLVAFYTVGTLMSVRFTAIAAAAGALLSAAAAAAVLWVRGGDTAMVFSHLSSSALAYIAAGFVGVYVASRRSHLAMVRDRAEEAVRAQRERARAAVAAERTRIARELHDVAAHHLSGMVVQAAAVERLIDRDPAAARSGAVWIRSQGKATLDNLRQVVGLLRDSDGAGEDGNAPVPGLSALEALVAEARGLGADVSFEREGEPVRLPPIADVSVYRIAQQALTNARQHAPGAPVRMRLSCGARQVGLEVANGPSPEAAPSGRTGTGLIGMRERADLVGAELEAGPSADGGWAVRLRLPVRAEDAVRDSEYENGVAS